ncbi:hypothetical protein M231_02341 [Tremella mesenterica]|uniref:Uncharacterized protein n=1 Tax=Tremella mesenterica TaxID=5217 RepID=A0A4Q1BQZ0_TREME|nr:hypothetical protein M231_02341 [Tremella mesenterica]
MDTQPPDNNLNLQSGGELEKMFVLESYRLLDDIHGLLTQFAEMNVVRDPSERCQITGLTLGGDLTFSPTTGELSMTMRFQEAAQTFKATWLRYSTARTRMFRDNGASVETPRKTYGDFLSSFSKVCLELCNKVRDFQHWSVAELADRQLFTTEFVNKASLFAIESQIEPMLNCVKENFKAEYGQALFDMYKQQKAQRDSEALNHPTELDTPSMSGVFHTSSTA